MKPILKKALSLLLMLALALPLCAAPAFAASAPRLRYELSVVKPADSTDEHYDPHNVYIHAGDTIELTFTIHFLDAAESYDLRWLQNELLYDSGFFYTTRTRGENNLIDVSFVQMLGIPAIKFSAMNVTLPGAGTAVASVLLRARTNLADGATTSLRSSGALCYDGSNRRCDITARDLTVTIGTRPLPTSSVHYDTAGGEMAPTAFPETDAEYIDYSDEQPYYAQTVLTGAQITLPGAPSRENHSFEGWSDGVKTYAAGAAYTVSSDTKLTALWKAWPVVTLDAAGGTLTGGTSYSAAPNCGIQLPSPERAGHNFLGWSDGTDTVTGLYIVGTENVTLTARWARYEAPPCEHQNAVFTRVEPAAGWTHIEGSRTHQRTVYFTAVCPDCGKKLSQEKTETADCAYSGSWDITATAHAHICAVCGGVADSAAHKLGSNGLCIVCSFADPTRIMPASDNVLFRKIGTTVSGTTALIGTISDAELNDLAADGTDADPIVIDAAAYGGIDSVILPSGLASRAAALTDAGGMTVTFATGALTFDDDALRAISAEGELAISLRTRAVSELSDAQRSAVGASGIRSAFTLSLTVDGKAVTSLEGGSVTVAAAFSPAAGESGKDYAVYRASADGTVRNMAARYENGKLIFTTGDFLDYVVAYEKASDARFVDVPADAYYFDAVSWALEKGVTLGVDAAHFAPDAPCTRAQFVTFLWRAAGKEAPSGENRFADVNAALHGPYLDAILWAVEREITNGTDGNGSTFSPEAVVNRAQAVTFMCRYAKGEGSGTAAFSDVSAGKYYTAAVDWAVSNGITKGTDVEANTFSPDAPCTRAQMVMFLYRLFEKKA